MKVLLLQPPVQDFYHTEVRLQPLGLAYLAAALRKWEPRVEVVVRDYHHGHGRRTVSLPPELAFLRDFYTAPDRSPFSTFHGYYHFGATFETLARDVAAERPDLVGISCLFSPYFRETLRCAEAIRERCAAPIVVGGSHASAAPESLLASPAVDFVVQGEGERPLVELVRALRRGASPEGVPNLWWKGDRGPVANARAENYEVEELPWPEVAELGPGRYTLDGQALWPVLSSRGCPHACAFCSVHATFGRLRRRPVEDVLSELQARYAQGYRAFDFEDDNLLSPPEEGRRLLRALAGAFPEGSVRLTAMNGVPHWHLDPELLSLLRRAGFRDLNFSLVTADPAAAHAAGRPGSPEKYAEVVRAALAAGLRVVSYQILGLPGEPLETTLETLRLGARLPVLLGASPFYLSPGSPLAERFGPLGEGDYVRARLTCLGSDRTGVDRRDVFTLLVATRILNFLKGLRLEGESVALETALQRAADAGGRGAPGVAALQELLRSGRLWAVTRRGPVPLTAFRPELFFRLWSGLRWIETQEGRRLEL